MIDVADATRTLAVATDIETQLAAQTMVVNQHNKTV
jgi:hypothetical protein